MDPATISIIAAVVGVLALLFGSGWLVRPLAKFGERARHRGEREAEIDDYLYHATMFLEGLPHFVRNTWEWGPSVPNYAAAGSFPPDSPTVALTIPYVRAATRDATAYYARHSAQAGKSAESLPAALAEISTIERQYWQAVDAYAKTRWPIRWRAKVRSLRQLRIPTEEHDRIRQLKSTRTNGGEA